jgi:hypothetical protein
MNTTRVRRSSLGHYGTSAMVAVATADADRPAPLSGAVRTGRGEQAKDQATLKDAQRDLARYAAIVSNQLAVTRRQHDTQRATVQQGEAAVQSDQVQIDAAKLNVAYCEITSPIDGITGCGSSISAISCRRVRRLRSSSPRSSQSMCRSRFPNGISTASGSDRAASVVGSGVQWR